MHSVDEVSMIYLERFAYSHSDLTFGADEFVDGRPASAAIGTLDFVLGREDNGRRRI